MYNRRFGVTVRLSVFRVPARVLIGRDSDCRLACTCGASVFRRRMRDTRLAGAVTTRYALPLARLETRDDDDAPPYRPCIASMPRGADGDTRDGATDAGRGRVGRNAVRSARAGRAYSAASWYFLILAILAWCPRGARPPTRDRRPPASSVHGRSFELPQAGHTAPQCADRASARIVYDLRPIRRAPRRSRRIGDRAFFGWALAIAHDCYHGYTLFRKITELTSDVDVTATRVDGRRRSIRTACTAYRPRLPGTAPRARSHLREFH